MRPQGFENRSAIPRVEGRPESDAPPEIQQLDDELRRLATQTEAHWNSYLDCSRDRSVKMPDAKKELIVSCIELIRLFESIAHTDLAAHMDPDAFQKVREEYEIACELLGKVLK